MVFEEVDSNEDSKAFDSIRLGFKTFNIDLLKPFMTKGLQKEVNEIQAVFDKYTKLYNKSGKTTFEDRLSDGFSVEGTLGLARFTNSNRKLGNLEFMYTYTRQRPVIIEILVNNDGIKYEFPLIHKKIKAIREEENKLKEVKDYPKIVKKYKELVSITNSLEDYYANPNDGLARKSNYLGGLSWYSLLVNNPSEAIEYANRGLEIWNFNTWINTNLALGYALNGDMDKAKELYT